MIKKELLLRILKTALIGYYLYELCYFYLGVLLIATDNEIISVFQTCLILYGTPPFASICFWFYRKKICRYLFWFIMLLSLPFTLFYLWVELFLS